MEQPWVIIVAISPRASDSQSDPSGLAVRPDGLHQPSYIISGSQR